MKTRFAMPDQRDLRFARREPEEFARLPFSYGNEVRRVDCIVNVVVLIVFACALLWAVAG